MAETGRTKYTVEQTASMSKAPLRTTFDSLIAKVATAGSSIVSLVTGLLAAFLILYSGYVLYDTFYTQNQAFTSSADLLQYKPVIMEDLGDGLTPIAGQAQMASINKDYRAWLTVYDSRIDYPVLQGTDDVYYATHDAFNNDSITGAIYMAAASSPDFTDNYNIVYGHHMDNGAMFGALDSYKEAGYFASHREGILMTDTGIYDLKIFAAIDTDAYEAKVYTVGNRDLAELLAYIEEHAVQSDMSAAAGATRILALSTCAGSTGPERFVVFATMTPRQLRINATGYTGTYDGAEHTLTVTANYPAGTTYRYSIDGGLTWSETKPVIRNAGEVNVLIEASNSVYGTATAQATLKVEPAPLVITVDNAQKTAGQPDPAFTAQALGLIPSDGILIGQYVTIVRVGGNEAAGTYPGVLTATMNAAWLASPHASNYAVTIVPGNFTITANPVLQLIAAGHDGVYDAQPHAVTVRMDLLPAGTTIQYSTDGGATWVNAAPSITNVGQQQVMVRATHAGYAPVTVNVLLRVTPAPVTVRADSISKVAGTDDPKLSASVTGVLDGFQIVYTVGRRTDNEAAGTYPDEIVVTGEAQQGNYTVTYVNGTLTITEPVLADIPEPPVPMAIFQPAGNRFGDRAWALVNLICLILTVYLFLPLLHLKDKFGRAKLMKKINEAKQELRTADELTALEAKEKERIEKTAMESRDPAGSEPLTEKEFNSAVEKIYYKVNKFLGRFRIGLLLELLLSVGAVIAFILTEDMRLPMILIDKWTPLMVLLLAACWGTDIALIRCRDKIEEVEMEEENAAEAE